MCAVLNKNGPDFYGPWTLYLGMQVLLMDLRDVHDILQMTWMGCFCGSCVQRTLYNEEPSIMPGDGYQGMRTNNKVQIWSAPAHCWDDVRQQVNAFARHEAAQGHNRPCSMGVPAERGSSEPAQCKNCFLRTSAVSHK